MGAQWARVEDGQRFYFSAFNVSAKFERCIVSVHESGAAKLAVRCTQGGEMGQQGQEQLFRGAHHSMPKSEPVEERRTTGPRNVAAGRHRVGRIDAGFSTGHRTMAARG